MADWLFGAEADKIQTTLFRVARQRQVVGGSSLLYEFEKYVCTLATTEFGLNNDDLLVAAGGNFRIVFHDKDKAIAFGNRLRTAYHHLLDAHITVAAPNEFQDYKTAQDAVAREIRKLKGAERGYVFSAHAPTTAYCQSSGIGLAAKFEQPTKAEKDKEYFSEFAWKMELAGRQAEANFLGRVAALNTADWDWAEEADEIAAYDGERKNVAYLVADANNMGKLFGACNETQTRQLSEDLQNALFIAMANVIKRLEKNLKPIRAERRVQEIQGSTAWKKIKPALPLILAGDDAFIMLPAKYALDSARQFCLEFEKAMNASAVVQALRKNTPPTIAAALVICKGHYPYTLAYRRGLELLKQTKQMIKAVAVENNGVTYSAMAVDAIVGSEIVPQQNQEGDYCASLSPYWLASQTSLSEAATRASISLEKILEQREKLKVLPSKRLAEARALYAPSALPTKDEETLKKWNTRLKDLQARILATARDKDTPMVKNFDAALKELGESNSKGVGHWRGVERSGEDFYAHGLPDLIEWWNSAERLQEEGV